MLFRSAGASRLFQSRPAGSAILGVLFIALGALYVSGWVPRWQHRSHAPGEAYVMAAACGTVAAYFFRCAVLGWRARQQKK